MGDSVFFVTCARFKSCPECSAPELPKKTYSIVFRKTIAMNKAVIYYKGKNRSYLLSVLSLIKKRKPGYDITLFLENKCGLEGVKTIILKTPSGQDNFNRLEDFSYKKFVFAGCDEFDLPNPVIVDIFSKNIDDISFINSECNFTSYKKYKSESSNNLSVFPGPIYPINMGSHQRAFNMLLYLNSNGSYTDVLITAGNDKQKKLARVLLGIICPNVYIYKNNKRKLPRTMRLRRFCENKVRHHIFKKGPAQDLFVERLENKATFSSKNMLKELVEKDAYENVIVNYAWMSKVRDLVSAKFAEKINWICDTHDVQYVRGKTNNKNEFRLFSNSKREKREEIDVLESFDHVLAISVSDKNELDKALKIKSTLVTSSFDYAYKPIRKKNTKSAIDFGFIGGKMDANVKALSYILTDWWPEITRISPASKLYIAGSVGNVEKIEELCFLEGNIERMGFVESLNDFYNKIDISLNPVVVKGGLNFKSVEALAAGKLLFTNSLGMECLGDNNLGYICDSSHDVVKQIIKIDKDRKLFESEKRRMQKLGLSYFSDSGAYSELVHVLDSGKYLRMRTA